MGGATSQSRPVRTRQAGKVEIIFTPSVLVVTGTTYDTPDTLPLPAGPAITSPAPVNLRHFLQLVRGERGERREVR